MYLRLLYSPLNWDPTKVLDFSPIPIHILLPRRCNVEICNEIANSLQEMKQWAVLRR